MKENKDSQELAYLQTFNGKIDPDKIGKKEGEGLEHKVLRYGNDEVVKIPIAALNPTLGENTMRTSEQQKTFLRLTTRFFKQYLPKSEVITNNTNNYLIIQQRIRNCEPITKNNYQDVSEKLQDISERNKQLFIKTGFTFDFTAWKGMKASIKEWIYTKLRLKKQEEFILSNVMKVQSDLYSKIAKTPIIRSGMERYQYLREAHTRRNKNHGRQPMEVYMFDFTLLGLTSQTGETKGTRIRLLLYNLLLTHRMYSQFKMETLPRGISEELIQQMVMKEEAPYFKKAKTTAYSRG